MDIENSLVIIDGQQWQADLPELDDLEVLVAPWENPAFERAMQKGIRALPPALRPDGNVEPTAYARVLGRALARTILFGWKNYKHGGVEKPFDAEYAEQILVDPRARVLREGVVAAAKRTQLGVTADQAAILGNSQTSSPGNGTGATTPKA